MYDQRNLHMLARQILAKTRNSPNIIARQNLLIYSMWNEDTDDVCSENKSSIYFTWNIYGIYLFIDVLSNGRVVTSSRQITEVKEPS